MRSLAVAAVLSVSAVGCGLSGSDQASGATGDGGGGHSSTAHGGGDTSSGGSGSAGGRTSGSGGGAGGGTGGSAPACTGKTLGPGDSDETLSFGGEDRTFHVHVPASYDKAAATPLVFVFHGFLQDNGQVEDQTKMTEKADAHGFVVVYPQGLDNSWNAGGCCGLSSLNGVDDVGFVKALLDHLETEYCVDEKRVYSSGYSNGGMLSHRLACEASDRFAAIGAVAGTLAIDDCQPSRAFPVLHVHGQQDFVVPYDGGIEGAESVGDTIAFWVKNDTCTDDMPTQVFMQGDATCNRYESCAAGSNVELCTISDGGHQWPGGNSAGDELGTVSMDLDASETIVKFFEAHPLP